MSETNEINNSAEVTTLAEEGTTPTPSVEGEAPKSLINEGEETGEKETVTAEEFVPLTQEDLVLPEGFTADPELQTEFLDVMNNQELSAKDRATALLNLQAKLMTKASEAGSLEWDNMQTQWKDEVKADPVIGGDKMRPALDSVSKLVTEYGSPELAGVFDITGAGNNVHVIKFLYTLSQKLTEGVPVQGLPSSANGDAASRLYPSMKG